VERAKLTGSFTNHGDRVNEPGARPL